MTRLSDKPLRMSLFYCTNKVMKTLLWIALLSLLGACQPSKITQTWVPGDVEPRQYKKILVLGVLTDNDHELQAKIENHLADDLKTLGYFAVPANRVYPPGTFVKGDTSRARSVIEGRGFDGILTIVLLNKEKEQVYMPGGISDMDYYNRSGRFDRYLSELNEKIYTPGYYAEQTKYIWENNFYDLYSRRLIYSARSSTFDIASKTTLAHTYGQLMVQNLVNKKIILKPVLLDEE